MAPRIPHLCPPLGLWCQCWRAQMSPSMGQKGQQEPQPRLKHHWGEGGEPGSQERSWDSTAAHVTARLQLPGCGPQAMQEMPKWVPAALCLPSPIEMVTHRDRPPRVLFLQVSVPVTVPVALCPMWPQLQPGGSLGCQHLQCHGWDWLQPQGVDLAQSGHTGGRRGRKKGLDPTELARNNYDSAPNPKWSPEGPMPLLSAGLLRA